MEDGVEVLLMPVRHTKYMVRVMVVIPVVKEVIWRTMSTNWILFVRNVLIFLYTLAVVGLLK